MRLLIALFAIFPMLQQTAIPPGQTSAGLTERPPVQRIIATVFDSQGRFIDGLRATDFIVQENGVQKEISQFLPDSETPVSIGVLIDTSGSMATAARRTVAGGSRSASPRWAAVLGATRVLLHLTRRQDEFQLMSFNSKMSVVQGFTHDHNKIESHLREMTPNGLGTNIADAVDAAIKEMKKSANRRRGLVVITDVEDNEGGGIAALRRTMHTEEVPVYIFALRPEGQVGGGAESKPVGDTLNTVSKSGEGKSLVLDVNRLQSEDSAIKIAGFITDFTMELRGKYTLSYISSVPDDQAQLRAIRVRIVPTELSVRFRRE